MKSGRKTSKRRSNEGKKVSHAPTRVLTGSGGCITCGFPRSRGPAAGSIRFAWSGLRPTRLRAPDALLQPAVATCRSSILQCSSVRWPTCVGDASSLLHFSKFSRNVNFGVFDPFSSDFYIFQSVIRINKFSSRIL